MNRRDNSPSSPSDRPKAMMDLQPKTLCELVRLSTETGEAVFMYDEKLDIFCFPEDGRFAFCDEFADWQRLWERGYLDF